MSTLIMNRSLNDSCDVVLSIKFTTKKSMTLNASYTSKKSIVHFDQRNCPHYVSEKMSSKAFFSYVN